MKAKVIEKTDEKMIASDYLTKLIETKGLDYLHTNSYEIYLELIEKKIASPLYARMVLLTLLSGIQDKALEIPNDISTLSRSIEDACFLKADMASYLAEIYSRVFSAENQAKWKRKTAAGFKCFCRKRWKFSWENQCTWNYHGGHMDCSGSGTVTVKVIASDKVKQELCEMLEDNPFLTAKEISAHFNDLLTRCLDDDFQNYCTDDDYYPPVVEDYHDNFDDVVGNFCTTYGFELLESEFDGGLSDYEPDDKW